MLVLGQHDDDGHAGQGRQDAHGEGYVMRNLQELTDFVKDEREEAHLDGDVDFFLSEQFLLLSLSQGFAILPMPEGDVYPGLSVLPLDDDLPEHAVPGLSSGRHDRRAEKVFIPFCRDAIIR